MIEKDEFENINNDEATSKTEKIKKRSRWSVKDRLRELSEEEITRFKEVLTTDDSQLRENMEKKEEKLLKLLLEITSIVILLYILIRFLF